MPSFASGSQAWLSCEEQAHFCPNNGKNGDAQSKQALMKRRQSLHCQPSTTCTSISQSEPQVSSPLTPHFSLPPTPKQMLFSYSGQRCDSPETGRKTDGYPRLLLLLFYYSLYYLALSQPYLKRAVLNTHRAGALDL